MMDKNQSLQILNRDTLKIIAAAAMLIDQDVYKRQAQSIPMKCLRLCMTI